MGPKVEAACRFVEVTGDMAAIGALEDAPAVLEGDRDHHHACRRLRRPHDLGRPHLPRRDSLPTA
jgi:carbamate kinase